MHWSEVQEVCYVASLYHVDIPGVDVAFSLIYSATRSFVQQIECVFEPPDYDGGGSSYENCIICKLRTMDIFYPLENTYLWNYVMLFVLFHSFTQRVPFSRKGEGIGATLLQSSGEWKEHAWFVFQ